MPPPPPGGGVSLPQLFALLLLLFALFAFLPWPQNSVPPAAPAARWATRLRSAAERQTTNAITAPEDDEETLALKAELAKLRLALNEGAPADAEIVRAKVGKGEIDRAFPSDESRSSPQGSGAAEPPCARPVGCTAKEGGTTHHVDCDGDGKLDWACDAPSLSMFWLVLSSRGCPKQWVPASPSECPSVPPPPPDGQIAGWEEGATGAPCACGPCPPRPCECTLQGGCTMFARLRDEAAGKGFTHKKRPTAFSLEHPKLDMDKTGMVVAHMKEFDVKVFTYPASEDQYVSGSLQNQGAWEDDKLHRLCNKYKEHGKGKSGVHFMDVGANIGSITIPMAKCIAGMGAVIAVEAMPHIADHVMAGIEANALPNVALYRYALTSGFGAPGGSLKMSLDSNNKGGTSVVGNKHNGAEIAQLGYTILEVPITTLDEILAQDERLKSVLVMKIDIEGSEGRALHGAQRLLTSYPPCFISIELIPEWTIRAGTPKDEILALLRRTGYNAPQKTSEVGDYFLQQTDLDKCLSRVLG